MPPRHSGLLVTGCIATFLLIACGGATEAGEAHYLLMFGSQRVPADPDYSHSFATFVRASWPGDEPCPVAPLLEAHTISWLPANGKVRTLALLPECGRNYGLHETMRFCLDNDMRVSLWGAYRMEPELYRRAVNQVTLLNSGRVRYKANDMLYRSNEVSNCIHAVSSISEGYRLRVGSPGWGQTASYYVLLELEPWVLQPGCTHPWVGSALGLDQYPLIYRDYQNPRSGTFAGPINRLLGRDRNIFPSYGPPQR
jgi:hypothetical protein